MPNTTVDELMKASKGLVYTSETDAPLRTFTWRGDGGPLTAERFRELSKTVPETPVKEVTLDDFFSTQTGGYEGQSEEEEQSVERFKNLRQVIIDALSDVKVLRVGDVNIHYYVVGKTKGGDWAGVWTKAVET